MSDKRAPRYCHAVLPEQITEQGVKGWPDFHPEQFCHRCGRRNAVWHAGRDEWAIATKNLPLGIAEILCPSCFAELYAAATKTTPVWTLILIAARPDPNQGAE